MSGYPPFGQRRRPSGSEAPGTRGFAAAFHLGADDRHIHVLDASGAALASIQALDGLAEQQARELELLRAEVNAMRCRGEVEALVCVG